MNLETTVVVIGPDQSAVTVPVTPTLYQDLDRDFDGFKGRSLVGQHLFTGDWPSWEIHPAGDEMVILVSGKARMVLDESSGHRTVDLAAPGDFVLVPKGTWHTAHISTPTRLLFITPGQGTENRDA